MDDLVGERFKTIQIHPIEPHFPYSPSYLWEFYGIFKILGMIAIHELRHAVHRVESDDPLGGLLAGSSNGDCSPENGGNGCLFLENTTKMDDLGVPPISGNLHLLKQAV